MNPHRGLYSALAVAVLLLSACGSSSDPEANPSSSNPEAVADAGPDRPDKDGGPSARPKDKKTPKARGGDDGDKKGDAGNSSTAPTGRTTRGGGEDAPAGGGDGSKRQAPGSGSRGARTSGPIWPAPGVYVYSQKGFEEFCSGTCSHERLPSRQQIDTRVTHRTSNGAVVVTETRSEGQVMRTTTRWSSGTALITRVYIRLTYRGFTFEQTYAPSPAVASLRFPLAAGKGWAGSWSGRVAGDYAVSVAGTQKVSAAGRSVKAVKLSTRTNFRGEFKGVANATLWLDPRTRAIVKTAGNLDVESNFGRYATGFKTALIGGPGY